MRLLQLISWPYARRHVLRARISRGWCSWIGAYSSTTGHDESDSDVRVFVAPGARVTDVRCGRVLGWLVGAVNPHYMLDIVHRDVAA